MKKKIIVFGAIALFLLSAFAIAQIAAKEDAVLNDPRFYVSFGDFLLKNGRADAAIKMYEKALEINPDDTAALNNMGFYYKEINPLLAEDFFKKALEVDSDYELARNNLALLYNSLENYEQAAFHLKILVSNYPDNINYNYDYAINKANLFYYKTKDYNDLQEALTYFKKVYSADPDFEHTFNNIKVLNEIEKLYN